MGVYLDIDLDYLVKPVKQKAFNEVRLYKNEIGTIENYEVFINKLEEKGLLKVKERKFFTNHRKSYTYWWIKKLMDMTVIHIDAHSDLYGNRRLDLRRITDTDMACNNYMWYALRDGFISKIYWVVPDDLYDLSNLELAKTFIDEEMLISAEYKEQQLVITFKIETRVGYKEISYIITKLDSLPRFEEIELMTVASSPEFTMQNLDLEMVNILKLLTATTEETNRILKTHTEMPDFL